MPGYTFTYARGNQTSKSSGLHAFTYEWTPENQLKRVTNDQVEVARYQYDALGRRIERNAAGRAYTYVYDGEDILKVNSSATQEPWPHTYVHGPGIDEPLAVVHGTGTWWYYHADALGSVIAATEAQGIPVLTRQYDEWGNPQGPSANQDGYAFTGREWDSETELYYYRARYYDPKIGRFISEDPIGFQAGVNFYSYVFNNPTNFTDPFGLDVNVCLFPNAAKNLGHIGFGVSGESGTQGFYDTGGSPLGGPGQIKKDDQKKKVCTVLPATPQQDQCMIDCRERRRRNPGSYHLINRNCTAFVEDCLIICGLPHGSGNPEPVNLMTQIGPRRR